MRHERNAVEFDIEPEADDAPEPTATARRRQMQPVLAGVVALVGAGLLLVPGGGDHADHAPDTVRPSPPAPRVHILEYTPWHERAIRGGGGAYIY